MSDRIEGQLSGGNLSGKGNKWRGGRKRNGGKGNGGKKGGDEKRFNNKIPAPPSRGTKNKGDGGMAAGRQAWAKRQKKGQSKVQ